MPPPPTHTLWLLPAIVIFYLEAGRSPGCGPRLPRQLYIMRGMLKVTVIKTVSRKTLHLQNRFDSSVCLQCRALLPRPPPPMVLWALITSLMPALPQRPPKWKWWMRSCQAPFPGWPWIHPLICYTASHDSDERNAGSWQHPCSLQKGKKKKKERWKVICLPPFNASLIYTTFIGPAWGGGDEVCLCNYVEQDIQHPWALLRLSKLPRCWHFFVFYFFN